MSVNVGVWPCVSIHKNDKNAAGSGRHKWQCEYWWLVKIKVYIMITEFIVRDEMYFSQVHLAANIGTDSQYWY